ncbi:hypothetical protein GALMADRAFT_222486 [Galerina marginata CBS 339.88]|uniref:T6SS Phospholipase effector Tle1-like catalytic domain-containing protein n=1 Tax=Galerina marginata (strain CBS 339.88) TaxID=685588 RepID=A0A067TPK8_GALM3|nr:hypothetical protein GALMADRAFT_222486 [Galerina marginata CBS 339.88]
MFIPERSAKETFRTFVILLDGTGDSVDEDVTNIVLLKNMLLDSEKEDSEQMVFYQPGIGSSMTGFDEQFDDGKAHSWKSWLHRTWDQAFASGFSDHVIAPYRWLAHRYRDGDRICIFGFSRGAYTARVLAGMITAVGLLPKGRASPAEAQAAYNLYDNFADLPTASAASKEQRDAKWSALRSDFQEFKAKNKSREVPIEFLGVWDTVNSVGYKRAIRLGFTRTNDSVVTFRHAIALDEHRVKFKQNNWSGPAKDKIPNPGFKTNDIQSSKPKTDVEEVWFAGCHCDIGGGSVLNGTRPNLAHISLRWMIRECFAKNTGMLFDSKGIEVIGIDPSSLYPGAKRSPPNPSFFTSGVGQIAVVEPEGWGPYLKSWIWSKKGTALEPPNKSEDQLDAADALAPAYDQLALKPHKWALMEQMGVTKERFKDGKWQEVSEKNLSHGRTIPPLEELHGGKIKVHWTVRRRMESTFKNGEAYVPLARVGYAENFDNKIHFTEAMKKSVEWVA